MAVEVLGLKACDTCRKAVKALQAGGHDVTIRDIRAAPLTTTEITDLLTQFGDAMINRRSTTWRGLSDAERARTPLDLLIAHPTLMKRPVVFSKEMRTLGWDKATQDAWSV